MENTYLKCLTEHNLLIAAISATIQYASACTIGSYKRNESCNNFCCMCCCALLQLHIRALLMVIYKENPSIINCLIGHVKRCTQNNFATFCDKTYNTLDCFCIWFYLSVLALRQLALFIARVCLCTYITKHTICMRYVLVGIPTYITIRKPI